MSIVVGRYVPKTDRTANGFSSPRRPGWRKIAVEFDEETFLELARRATQEKTSFAAQVRLLVEWGLEA